MTQILIEIRIELVIDKRNNSFIGLEVQLKKRSMLSRIESLIGKGLWIIEDLFLKF